jgi:uncharacterized OB-fold protein
MSSDHEPDLGAVGPGKIPMVDYLVLDPTPHLVAHECAACGALYFDRRNACGACGEEAFVARALSDRGTVLAYTVVYRGPRGVPTPFTSAIVELDGGGVVKANLVGPRSLPPEVDALRDVRLTAFTAGVDDAGVEAIGFRFEEDAL